MTVASPKGNANNTIWKPPHSMHGRKNGQHARTPFPFHKKSNRPPYVLLHSWCLKSPSRLHLHSTAGCGTGQSSVYGEYESFVESIWPRNSFCLARSVNRALITLASGAQTIGHDKWGATPAKHPLASASTALPIEYSYVSHGWTICRLPLFLLQSRPFLHNALRTARYTNEYLLKVWKIGPSEQIEQTYGCRCR